MKFKQQFTTYFDQWAKIWELPLAAEETNYVVIGARDNLRHPSYTLRGQALNPVQEVRDLGFLKRKH